jgi:hypothetical protein
MTARTVDEFVTLLMNADLARTEARKAGDWDRVDYIGNVQSDTMYEFKQAYPIQYASWLDR